MKIIDKAVQALTNKKKYNELKWKIVVFTNFYKSLRILINVTG